MAEEQFYTEAEAERYFAIKHNGLTWELLEKADRSSVEDGLMVHAAHSSCMHWLQAGTPTHHQRGEWLLARVYSELGYTDAAVRHASVCLELTETHAEMMQDFDRAYAYEAVARASALAGDMSAAIANYKLAEKAGEAIEDDENKSIFMGDLKGGNWHNFSPG
ncbi:MAG: hypothetical protein P1S60_17070 [Anaerolineae bacterium]|nr:hypothetical protein [Anaerolineae bacterium]